MGIFQRMFGDSDSSSNAAGSGQGVYPTWQALTSEEQLDDLVAKSHERPVLLFKHSTRCSISTVALSRVERGWAFAEGELDPWFVDLIQYRGVSNAIAERFGIPHQSPQAILLKDGKPVYDASHSAIDVPSLQQALAA